MTRARVLVGMLVGLLIAGSAIAPASADTDGIIPVPEIAEMLGEVPGGVLIDENHAVWPELGMELSVPTSSAALRAAAVTGCSTNLVCLYTGYTRTGSMLTFSGCGLHTIPSNFIARSIANSRSGGYAQARYGSTIRATAYAGGWANIYGSANSLRCVL